MQANILGFDSKLPSLMYWDSSFVLNFCIDGAKYFKECKEFIEKLQKSSTVSLISNMSLDEIWYGLLRVNLINDFGNKWLEEYRKNSSIIKKYLPVLRRAVNDLSLLPFLLIVETKTEMTLQALDLIEKYNLFPRDAIHLATMKFLGVKDIVSTDADFARVSDINLYTCNPKLI